MLIEHDMKAATVIPRILLISVKSRANDSERVEAFHSGSGKAALCFKINYGMHATIDLIANNFHLVITPLHDDVQKKKDDEYIIKIK